MNYRKKPVIIQALRWDGSLEGMHGINYLFPEMKTVGLGTYDGKVTHWEIGTLEGKHSVSIGDYVIKGVKGEYYPCKPDIFEMTYEAA